MRHARQSNQTTIADALRLFYLDCEARNLAPRTQEYYREKLEPFAKWLAETNVTHARQLTSTHIRRFLVAQQARELSPYTVHAFARCVKTLCLFLVREGALDVSPMARVKMPKLPQDLLPPFEAHEIRALLRACNCERDTAIVLTLLDSGVRASELCALDIGDLDLTTGALAVFRGKGRKSRVTYVGARTRQAVLRYFNTRSVTFAAAPLFVTLRDGQRLRYDGLRALLKRLSERADVADVDAHRFRRTFAIEALRAGMPVMQLAQMMGHGSLPVLQRYLRLLSDDLAQAHREHGPVDGLLRGKR